VRTTYPYASSRETTTDTLLETLYYIMESYSVDFTKLILEYMTNVCNLSINFPLCYSNLLMYIFRYFNISLEAEEHLET